MTVASNKLEISRESIETPTASKTMIDQLELSNSNIKNQTNYHGVRSRMHIGIKK